MFNLGIELSAKPIILVAIVQILIMMFLGILISSIFELFYDKVSYSYEVVKQKDYNGDTRGIPNRYRFVAIKYNEIEEVEDEKFYTFFGDYTRVRYSDGKYSGISTLMLSNILILLFPLIGILLLMIANFYEASTITQNLAELPNIQIFRSIGGLLFISAMISDSVKLIFDFAYTGYE